jgi:ATP-dependent DNA helicase RecQ
MSVCTDSNVAAGPQALLKERFGLEQFYPGQREVIEHLLAGRSAAAVFPTGGGKSLCYQLPALMLPGLTLVISPLIALMKDQIDVLLSRGIAAARLDSSLSADQYREVMEQIRDGSLQMLYVAPERLVNERFRAAMRNVKIALFAVDEAHCISEWGHNFRPDYLKLAGAAKQCGAGRVLALTATATDQVLADICRLFEVAPEAAIRTPFYRSNLTVLTTPTTAAERDDLLLSGLRKRPPGPAIVYVTLQRTAEEVAERLGRSGFESRPYHAGLADDVRAAAQDWFMQSDQAIVVATIAFGMGIDKANIRYVYHYNLPKSLENFSQEIGRAGRDGQAAICETLVCPDDLNVLENFIYGDTPTLQSIESLVNEIFAYEPQFDVSLFELSSSHDIRVLVVRTLMVYLELEGYLEGGTPFYSVYQFKPLASSREILERFDENRRRYLQDLFRQARKAKIWFHIDVEQAGNVLGGGRDRVVRALDYLGQQQLLEVRAAGVRFRYQRLQMPADLNSLAQSMHARMLQREVRDLGRLQQVLDLVRNDGCQVSALGGYFGQPLDQPCGHCTWCLANQTPIQLPGRAPAEIDTALWRRASALRQTHKEVLADPRSLTRFLCGVRSPRLVRAKLTRDPLFGALGHVPFQKVLERAMADA